MRASDDNTESRPTASVSTGTSRSAKYGNQSPPGSISSRKTDKGTRLDGATSSTGALAAAARNMFTLTSPQHQQPTAANEPTDPTTTADAAETGNPKHGQQPESGHPNAVALRLAPPQNYVLPCGKSTVKPRFFW